MHEIFLQSKKEKKMLLIINNSVWEIKNASQELLKSEQFLFTLWILFFFFIFLERKKIYIYIYIYIYNKFKNN